MESKGRLTDLLLFLMKFIIIVLHCTKDIIGFIKTKKATNIFQNYYAICFEDLSLKGMQGLWGRKVSDYV